MSDLRKRLQNEKLQDFACWWLDNECPDDVRVSGGNPNYGDWHHDINDMVQDDEELERLYMRYSLEETE